MASDEAKMDQGLRGRLLALAARDAEVRARLAADGSLFQNYHPEMEAVHRENAAALEAILIESGWPGEPLAGTDGAEAAWRILQHAIGLPDFQRRGLALLTEAAGRGEVPSWQPAYLDDRIRSFEGRPQLYGTQFDWDEQGLMSPLPIEQPENVDQRRAAIGLPPLAEATARHRRDSSAEHRPKDLAERRREMQNWAAKTGWRAPPPS
jgi:hypothetical protein